MLRRGFFLLFPILGFSMHPFPSHSIYTHAYTIGPTLLLFSQALPTKYFPPFSNTLYIDLFVVQIDSFSTGWTFFWGNWEGKRKKILHLENWPSHPSFLFFPFHVHYASFHHFVFFIDVSPSFLILFLFGQIVKEINSRPNERYFVDHK